MILKSIKVIFLTIIVQVAVLNKTSIKLINSKMTEINGARFSKFPLKYYIMCQ